MVKLGLSQRGSDPLQEGKRVANSHAECYSPSLACLEPNYVEYKPAKVCLHHAPIPMVFCSFLMFLSAFRKGGFKTVYGHWDKLSQCLPYNH